MNEMIDLESLDSVENKISRAKVQIMFNHMFLSCLVARLEWVEDESVKVMGAPTMCVSVKQLRYHPEFVEKTGHDELMGVVAHELLHVIFQHVLEWRNPKGKIVPIWTMAQEHVVNDAVINMFGLSLPDGIIYDEEAKGMYTEEAYQFFLKKFPQINDSHSKIFEMMLAGGGEDEGDEGEGSSKVGSGEGDKEEDGEGESPGGDIESLLEDIASKVMDSHKSSEGPMTEEEETILKGRIKDMVTEAATAAKMAGKMPAGLERLVGEIIDPKIPWQHHLANLTSGWARDDYSYRRPSRKYIYQGIVMPSLRSELLEVAIGIDTSGSIGKDEMTEFISEILGIMNAFQSYRLHVFGCDHAVHGYEIIEPGQSYDLTDVLSGGGGTSFVPVLKRIEEEGLNPEALIYFTDCYGDFGTAPNYSVLWLIKGSFTGVPYGKEIHMD
jgi:predicted metal-dependent peptidase